MSRNPENIDLKPFAVPWSKEAEEAILGTLLLNNERWHDLGDSLTESKFYSHANRLIFGAIGGLIGSSKVADSITVAAALEASGNLQDVGGHAGVFDLCSSVSSASNIRRYSEIIADKALLRDLQKSVSEIQEISVTAGGTAVDKVAESAGIIAKLDSPAPGANVPTSIADDSVAFLDRLTDLADGKVEPGVSTGIRTLDLLLTGGFKPGKQIILAARPSIGKSSLAMQIGINLARAGHGALILSLEMTKEDLLPRYHANLGSVNLDNLLTGKLDDGEWGRLTEGMELARSMPLHTDDQAALSMRQIAAKARHMKRNGRLKLLVLDYLQLASGAGKDSDNRHHQIEALSRGLKQLAKELGITILTLSQLNRDVEKRPNGEPVLADLKESGAIEEDADVVLLLSRIGEPSSEGVSTIRARVAKNRQGALGVFGLSLNGKYQQWRECTLPDPVKPDKPSKRYDTKGEI